MAMTMTADMMKCYLMRTYEVKPECRETWCRELPRYRSMWERHGAACIGQWQMCMGGSCTYMMMMEFPNSAAAMKCETEICKDPDYAQMCSMCCNYPNDRRITCPIMKRMPIAPMCMPGKNCNIAMMRYTLCPGMMPCMAMKDCQMFIERMMERFCKPCGMRMIGCFVPSCGMTCNCICIMMEMPQDKATACMTKMEEFSMACCMDAGWCDTMKPFYNHCSEYSMHMMNCCM